MNLIKVTGLVTSFMKQNSVYDAGKKCIFLIDASIKIVSHFSPLSQQFSWDNVMFKFDRYFKQHNKNASHKRYAMRQGLYLAVDLVSNNVVGKLPVSLTLVDAVWGVDSY